MADVLDKAKSLYDHDFYAWTREQAAVLRSRAGRGTAGDAIDWDRLAEEVEDLGESQRSEIESRLAILLVHLLKWRFQPTHRSSGWKGTIVEQRSRLARRLRRSPSLRPYPAAILAEEYEIARLKAAGETDLPEAIFPETCPFTIEQVLDPAFYPDAG
ncbi:DUF29 domain-containing protein [Jiella sp. M17.18]|uniref:DUF29 domain-containing protein n=1 Tax=Jiella sp. M17.18 TaxID=3234247 RepID=UPI0034DE47CD